MIRRVWPQHRTRDETLDFREIMDRIMAQPWSDGTVGGHLLHPPTPTTGSRNAGVDRGAESGPVQPRGPAGDSPAAVRGGVLPSPNMVGSRRYNLIVP